MTMTNSVWVFNGDTGRFCSAVFSNLKLAEEWIKEKEVTGLLTEYPLNTSAYDWSVKNDFFTPKKEKHFTPSFIANFTSASQEHMRFENGNKVT